MSTEILACYLFAVLIGGFSIFLAADTHRRQKSRPALTLLYFLIAYLSLGFLNLIGRHGAYILFASKNRETMVMVNYLFAFLTFPLLISTVYLFVRLTAEIRGSHPSALFKVFFFSFWSLFFLALVFSIKLAFEAQREKMIRELLPAGNLTAIGLYLVACLYLIVRSLSIQDGRRKRTSLLMGIILLASHALLYALTSAPAAPLLGDFFPLVTILLYFAVHVPALLYFRSRSADFTQARISSAVDEQTLCLFFEKYGISQREAQIVRLLLRGKSNDQIKRELFISLSTVKNHVYNIYRKLKVKNRIQLALMIQEFAGMD